MVLMKPTARESTVEALVPTPKYGNDIIIINTAGAEGDATNFYVHANLIIENSNLLALELKKKDSAKGSPRTFTLQDQSAAEFGIFVSFLYTNYVYSASPEKRDEVEWDRLVKLWVLAQRLQSTSFKDAIVDAFIEKDRCSEIGVHLMDVCDSFFPHVKGESGLGKWLAETAACYGDSLEFQSLPFKPEHSLFFYETMKAFARKDSQGTSSLSLLSEVSIREEGCGYHEHDEGSCGSKLRQERLRDIHRDHTAVLKLGNQLVTVHVGSEDDIVTFTCHADLLCRHSEFFKAALKKQWKEGKEGVVRLPEDGPESFELFQKFIYSGRVRLTCLRKDEEALLEEAWSLGDSLISTSFKDVIVDEMCRVFYRSKPLALLPRMFHNSPCGAGVRKLCVDLAVSKWSLQDLKKEAKEVAYASFFTEVAIGLKEQNEVGDKTDLLKDPECHYHEHTSKESCYKVMFEAQ